MRELIGRVMWGLVIVAIIAGIVVCVASGGLARIAQLTARETYEASAEVLSSQGKEALFISVKGGSIPTSTIRGRTPNQVEGLGEPWRLCFRSVDADEYFVFGPSSKDTVEMMQTYRCANESSANIDLSRWLVDSEEALQIAEAEAVSLDREDYIPALMELTQGPEGSPNWRVEFLPPTLGYGGVGLSLIIDAETGAVLEIAYPPRSYE